MAKKKSTSTSLSFEETLDKLEQIVHQLEDGQLGLAESLSRYEQGVGLLRAGYETLEKAERRVELLSGVDPDGNPRTEPFEDSKDGAGLF